MKINITVKNNDISIQLIDIFYAYVQSLDDSCNSEYKIQFSDSIDQSADVNIFWDSRPVKSIDTNGYDLVFLGNAGEPMSVSSDGIHQMWGKNNVYLMFNSHLMPDHMLKDKVIYFPDPIQQCRDYWTRHFYPHHHKLQSKKSITRSNNIIAINGANRTVRYHFFNKLKEKTNISVRSNFTKQIINTNHSYWESKDDFNFRNFLEEKYADVFEPELDYTYFTDSCVVGIDGKFGSVPPGYEIMSEYFEYSCIVYPESSWQNDELSITEKGLKCFYSGSLPFPIAGANVNRLYNELGFYTAWNLLPEELQSFDQEKDHFKRHDLIINALNWLDNNKQVFKSDLFKQLTLQNKLNMLTCNHVQYAIDKIIGLLDECRH